MAGAGRRHFFADPANVSARAIKLTERERDHIKNALRMNVGESIIVTVPALSERYHCRISSIGPTSVEARIIEEAPIESIEPRPRITLYQALLKKGNFESVVYAAAELGCALIVPTITRRVVKRPDPSAIANRIERWDSMARSSARLSLANRIMSIAPGMVELDRVEADSKLNLILSEDETRTHIADLIDADTIESINIISGPEGGFETEEIERVRARGYIAVSVSRYLLRAQTAPIVALGIIGARLRRHSTTRR